MSFYDIHIFLVLNGYLDIELNDDLVIYFCTCSLFMLCINKIEFL